MTMTTRAQTNRPPNPFESPQAADSITLKSSANYAQRRPGVMLGFGLVLGGFFGCVSGALIAATLGFVVTATLAPLTNSRDRDLYSKPAPLDVACFGVYVGGFSGACSGAIVGLIVGTVTGMERPQSTASWWTATLLCAGTAGAFGVLGGLTLNSELRLSAPSLLLCPACATASAVGGFICGMLLAARLRNVAARWRKRADLFEGALRTSADA